MNQNINQEEIKQLLNRSLAKIEPATLARLRGARTQALARYDARIAAPAFAPALSKWAGHSTHHTHHPHHRTHYWAAAILLAASLFGGATYWQHVTEHEIATVDIAILTDDLPMRVYVD
jgi:hypothetical protein